MDEPVKDAEPANLRLLRRLVTGLTAVMIVGVLLIIALIVIRLSSTAPWMPDTIDLPGDARAVAVTQGRDWYAVVTDGDEILIFDRATGRLRQTVTLTNGAAE